MKKYIILTVGSIVICFYVYFKKENEIGKLNEKNQLHSQVERSAIQSFNEVNSFLKLFPKAQYKNGSFIEHLESPSKYKYNMYICNLPPFTISEKKVTFSGRPTFEGSSLILQEQSGSVENKKIDSFSEIEEEFLKNPSEH